MSYQSVQLSHAYESIHIQAAAGSIMRMQLHLGLPAALRARRGAIREIAADEADAGFVDGLHEVKAVALE